MALSKLKTHRIQRNEIFNAKSLLQTFVGCSLTVLAMRCFLSIVLNNSFVYLGYRRIGKTFAVKIMIAVLLLAAGLQFVHSNAITPDKLFIVFFGGLLMGTSVGILFRTGAVVDGIEQYTSVHFISSKPDEMKDYNVNEINKGIKVYKGKRGYLPGSFDVKTDAGIIETIVTWLEKQTIQAGVRAFDPKAFLYVQSIKEASGSILKPKAHGY